MLNPFEAGKLGEHICMVRLMKMGVACELVNLDTIDIVAHYNNQLIKIQVKSSILKSRDSKSQRNGYQYNTSYSGKKKPLTREQCDIIAFVAVEPERVIFAHIDCVSGQTTRRFSPSKFDKDQLEERSWQKCLDRIFLSD